MYAPTTLRELISMVSWFEVPDDEDLFVLVVDGEGRRYEIRSVIMQKGSLLLRIGEPIK